MHNNNNIKDRTGNAPIQQYKTQEKRRPLHYHQITYEHQTNINIVKCNTTHKASQVI